MSLLETLHFPEDIKNLNQNELKTLAEEIRGRLVSVVSETGGHLASNLGVVELTIALYRIFDPFTDKIIYDVGHQSYVHKILTGRNTEMYSIRKMGGLSGFPCRQESRADCFDTGHSSTSISAALGMARARDLQGQKYRVAAVIGDGALTGGMAYEALNDAGRSFCPMLIILNDNGMSISKNVGGMSRYLGRIRTGKSYIRIKKGIKTGLSKIPLVGNRLVRWIQRLKASIKLLLIPGEFFEELGLRYVGPVDGHNIEAVEKAISKALFLGGPVLLHVITQKGRGYQPAESDPCRYHGIQPAGQEAAQRTGAAGQRKMRSFSENFGSVLCALAKEDPAITAVSAAMPEGTGLSLFAEQYPERFYDVGIAEQHAVTMAAGMAAAGLKPYVGLYATFLQRAYDQLLHDCALQALPVVIGVDRAGAAGPDGKTHQGIYDLAFLRHMPHVIIAAPCCIEEQTALLRLTADSAYRRAYMQGPYIIRYPAKESVCRPEAFPERQPVRHGKGIYMRPYTKWQVCIITAGIMVSEAITASDLLQEAGITVQVFHARFIKPLDEEGICAAAAGSTLVVTLEDGVLTGGFGEAVRILLENRTSGADCMPQVISIGYPDEPIPHGTIPQLYARYGLDGKSVAQRIREMFCHEA